MKIFENEVQTDTDPVILKQYSFTDEERAALFLVVDLLGEIGYNDFILARDELNIEEQLSFGIMDILRWEGKKFSPDERNNYYIDPCE